MVKLPKYDVSPEMHRSRQHYHESSAKNLKDSIEKFTLSRLDTLNLKVTLPEEIPLASNPMWANQRFGAVNTVQNSACVAFIAQTIFNHFSFEDIFLKDLLKEIEEKGYRLWKFSNNPRSLNLPDFNLKEIQKQFPPDDYIQYCKSLKEVYQLYGHPVGIGGSMFLIDNVIQLIAGKSAAYKTRIQSVNKMLLNLYHGIPVPLRVENCIYHKDTSKADGHYVILYGIEKGNAIIVDWSYEPNGINVIPVKQLFKAMIENEKLICAWDLSSCNA